MRLFLNILFFLAALSLSFSCSRREPTKIEPATKGDSTKDDADQKVDGPSTSPSPVPVIEDPKKLTFNLKDGSTIEVNWDGTSDEVSSGLAIGN